MRIIPMDHDYAVQIEAPMKYALGELTDAERDSFEEHFADCSKCIADTEAAAAFAANAKAVFLERGNAPPRKRFEWLNLRPALGFSLALNAALAAVLGFAVLRPVGPGGGEGQANLVDVAPIEGPTRSGAEAKQTVVRTTGRDVVVQVYLPEHYERYSYSVTRTGSSAAELAGELPGQGAGESLNVRLRTASLKPAEYQVTVAGQSGTRGEVLGLCRLIVSKQ
jgi:hypothetical protein